MSLSDVSALPTGCFSAHLGVDVSGLWGSGQCSFGHPTGHSSLPWLAGYVLGGMVASVEVPDDFLVMASSDACPSGWQLGEARRWAW